MMTDRAPLALPLAVGDPELDAFAALLDVLAAALDVPGVHHLTPDEPIRRRDLDALVCALQAPGLVYVAGGLVEITGCLHGSRITVTAREADPLVSSLSVTGESAGDPVTKTDIRDATGTDGTAPADAGATVGHTAGGAA